jgi:CheY-like chemotaxis protein
LVEKILSKFNFKILHAKNGIEAVEECRRNSHIDLVLMDIKMPEMDGQTALFEIRKFKPHLPIIALTAYAMQQEREQFIKNGFTDYIPKPINKIELIDKIFTILGIERT